MKIEKYLSKHFLKWSKVKFLIKNQRFIRLKKYCILTLLLYSSAIFAEYRVYQYYVRPKVQNLTNVGAELVTSTLNPVSYVAYHGGNSTVEVNLLRSWQCMGDTSEKPICTISNGEELNPQTRTIP